MYFVVRNLLCFVAVLLLCFSAEAFDTSALRYTKHAPPIPNPTPVRVDVHRSPTFVHKLLARVTVYWPGEPERRKGKRVHWTSRRLSSTGVRLHRNVVAVDPRIIPYGSHVKFPDAVCPALDTGSAVKSRKAARLAGRTLEEKAAIVVDRFFETKREALAWARLYPPFLALEIIPPVRRF